MNDDVALSDLVGADEAPDFALLDLSAVDRRFLPALIAGHLARIVEAWELAGTGSHGPLENLASAQATKALLRSSEGTRLIVRDAVLKSCQRSSTWPDTLRQSRWRSRWRRFAIW